MISMKRVNKLRALLWVNWLRVKQGYLPRWWVKDTVDVGRRSKTCPVARMVRIDPRLGGYVINTHVQLTLESAAIRTPSYVNEVIRTLDQEYALRERRSREERNNASVN